MKTLREAISLHATKIKEIDTTPKLNREEITKKIQAEREATRLQAEQATKTIKKLQLQLEAARKRNNIDPTATELESQLGVGKGIAKTNGESVQSLEALNRQLRSKVEEMQKEKVALRSEISQVQAKNRSQPTPIQGAGPHVPQNPQTTPRKRKRSEGAGGADGRAGSSTPTPAAKGKATAKKDSQQANNDIASAQKKLGSFF